MEDDLLQPEYQTRLLQVALQKNTILFLTSESDKIYIATMMVKYFKPEPIRKIKDGAKRIIFIVGSESRISKCGTYMKHLTVYRIGYFMHQLNLDKEKWDKYLDDFDVLIMTPSLCLTALRNGYLKFEYMKLIIFDDCNRISESPNMRLIMKEYEKTRNTPHILGMTTTFINCNVAEQMNQEIDMLQTTFHGKIITPKEYFVKI